MKKAFFIAVALLMVFSVMVMAEDTGGANWSTPYDPLTAYLNSNDIDHRHPYTDRQTSKYKSPLGLELDVTLYEMELGSIPVGIGTRGTYDFNNGVWGCFVKADVNLSPMVKGMFGIK